MPSFIAELCDLASDHQSQGVVNTSKASSLQVLLLAAFAPVLCILQRGHLTCFSWRWENWPSERRFSCAWVGSARSSGPPTLVCPSNRSLHCLTPCCVSLILGCESSVANNLPCFCLARWSFVFWSCLMQRRVKEPLKPGSCDFDIQCAVFPSWRLALCALYIQT